MEKRILMFVDIYPPPFVGGAEETTRQEFDLLSDNGFDIQVYTLTKPGSAGMEILQSQSGAKSKVIKLQDFPYHPGYLTKKPKFYIRAYWHLIHFLWPKHLLKILLGHRSFKPAVIYCGNITAWGTTPWIYGRLFRIPILQVVHDYGFVCFRKTMLKQRGMNNRCKGDCISCIPRKVTTKFFWPGGTVNFVSKRQREIHNQLKVFIKNSIAIVQPPILQNFVTVSDHGLEREYEFGYLGRVSPEKGIERVLILFERLNLCLVIAGDGEPSYVQYLRDKYPKALFLGHQDKWSFLGKVNLLIVPSVWEEPAGRIVREALVCGCNVAVSKLGGLREMGEISPSNLFVFNPYIENELESIVVSKEASIRRPLSGDFQEKLDIQNGIFLGYLQQLMEDIASND